MGLAKLINIPVIRGDKLGQITEFKPIDPESVNIKKKHKSGEMYLIEWLFWITFLLWRINVCDPKNAWLYFVAIPLLIAFTKFGGFIKFAVWFVVLTWVYIVLPDSFKPAVHYEFEVAGYRARIEKVER